MADNEFFDRMKKAYWRGFIGALILIPIICLIIFCALVAFGVIFGL